MELMINHEGSRLVKRAEGIRLYLQDPEDSNREIECIDASGGPAVVALGQGNKEVIEAIVSQLKQIPYCSSQFGTPEIVPKFAEWVLNTTIKDGQMQMTNVYVGQDGSGATEGMMKYVIQRNYMRGEKQRVEFIGLDCSYHGATLGALSVGGYPERQEHFKGYLKNFPKVKGYDGLSADSDNPNYVKRLIQELDNKFEELKVDGRDTVAAFVIEPVVGAALGCVMSPKEYFQGVREVCHRHGALLVFDEVMCGMGRTGTMHAWQQPDIGVVPDIQTFGKALGGGYVPVAGFMVKANIAKEFNETSPFFTHGHTYDGYPGGLAGGLAIGKQIEKFVGDGTITKLGNQLEELLKRFKDYWFVKGVSGIGLFHGIRFHDRKTKDENGHEKSPHAEAISQKSGTQKHPILVYQGRKCLIVSPAYTTMSEEISEIVRLLTNLFKDYEEELTAQGEIRET
ncbi:aminotransferase-like protein [Whalleya microplaca]|nr:aminotransferase-like protein [Whalleya microplaca]